MKENKAKASEIIKMHSEEMREMKFDKAELLKRIDIKDKKIIELEAEVARLRLFNSGDNSSSNTVLLKYQEAIRKRDDQKSILQFQLNKLKTSYHDEINKYRVKLAKRNCGDSKKEYSLEKTEESTINMSLVRSSRSGIFGERKEVLSPVNEKLQFIKTKEESDFIRYFCNFRKKIENTLKGKFWQNNNSSETSNLNNLQASLTALRRERFARAPI